jgi:hypothetical protein
MLSPVSVFRKVACSSARITEVDKKTMCVSKGASRNYPRRTKICDKRGETPLDKVFLDFYRDSEYCGQRARHRSISWGRDRAREAMGDEAEAPGESGLVPHPARGRSCGLWRRAFDRRAALGPPR